MNLRQFEGKNVRLTDKDGEIFEGYVSLQRIMLRKKWKL